MMHQNKKILLLAACFALLVILPIHLMGGTAAAPDDYTQSFQDPFTNYDRVIEVNASLVTPIATNAWNWANGDNTVLTLDWTQGDNTAKVKGIKPGVSTISIGTTIGQVLTMRYKVVDSSNIKSYTVAGGLEGRIAKKSETLTIPITATDNKGNAAADSKIAWKSLNSAVASVSGKTITAQADNGAAIILGTFFDPWGLEHTIPYLIIIGN